jgi:hypothetical protein
VTALVSAPVMGEEHPQRHAYPNAHKPWLNSDLLFLEMAALGGMSLTRIASFLGREEGAGGVRGASRSGSASVTTMHALFTRKVECKMAPVQADPNPMTLAHALDPRDAVTALKIVCGNVAGAANPYHAARTRRVSAATLAPTSARLSRTFN